MGGTISRLVKGVFSSAELRIRGKLLKRFRHLKTSWEGSVREHDGVRAQIKAEKEKPEYAPLLKLLDKEMALRGKRKQIERHIIDCQVEIAKELDMSVEHLTNDHFIDTDTGIVSHKEKAVPESQSKTKNHVRGGLPNGAN